jgi:hypothetical protein
MELHTSNITVTRGRKVFSVFVRHFLVMDFNSGDSSASVLTALSLLVTDFLTILSVLQLPNSQAGGHFTSTSWSSLHSLTFN